ncbi:outer membrane beta-barrel family protein [Rhabdobacter roseus]|uniref:TonB-dependent receptor n=1 Tax=Rhabdobacter roseus TaxID=1655419 RepID=A0A840U0L7_9BACT|nr:TonB-dependent receptor [Rhabdobacter roseus]MBB5287442.1 hypothetical protein [Rhabdobacter roseus]
MKYLFVLLLGACFASEIIAQVPGSQVAVLGRVLDSLSGKPVPFATVAVFQQERLVEGTLTDSLGYFAFQTLPLDTYYLAVSAVGYRRFQTAPQTLDASQPTWQVGVVRLALEAQNLQTVTVRGQKPLIEQRADGLVFNAESLPTGAGSDATDLLRKVPLLTVDANGGLSLRGSSQLRVFIDGKPSEVYASSVADALKAIPGESIVKVEVITHPSARYDAEGTDGVVHITTRKSRDNATNGNLSGVLGNRSEQIMADVHTKYQKWLLKADGFYQKYWNRNGSVLERETGTWAMRQNNESRQRGDYFFGGLNVLYSLDSLHTLNAGYRLRWSPYRTHTVSDYFYAENEPKVPTFRRYIDSPVGNNGHTFNLGYTGTSRDKRKEFSLLGMYFLFGGTSRYALEQLSGEEMIDYRENFRSQTHNRDLTLQADYAQAFGKQLKWETGGKLMQKKLASDSEFRIYDFEKQYYSYDAIRSNAFSYQSAIYALYTQLSLNRAHWTLLAGARYEHTSLRAVFQDTSLQVPSFQNLVPNLLLSRKLGAQSTLKLSYTVRLVRPYFSLLNPTVNNADSLTIQYGNPYLRPESTRRYQLSFTRNAPKLFTDAALFFNQNHNSFENVRLARPDGVFESTWQNLGRNRRLGLSLNLSWKPTAALSLGGTLTAQYVRLESPALGTSNAGLMRIAVLNGTYKLPQSFSIDFYGYFDANQVRLQGYRSGWKYYSLTVSKKSKNERANVSLRMDTLLTPHTFIREETVSDSFRQLQSHRYQNQHLRLSFSYKLGKKEIKSPRVRQVENPE